MAEKKKEEESRNLQFPLFADDESAAQTTVFHDETLAHAKKKTSFWRCPVQSMFSFVFFFFAKSKELTPSWRDAHTERELLQNRLKMFQRDGKLENEEGFAHRSQMEMQG